MYKDVHLVNSCVLFANIIFNKPDIVSLLEPRISGSKANLTIAKMGWDKSHRVNAIGFSGGIWIGWKNSINLKVVRNHPQFILTRICLDLFPRSILVAFVYGSSDKVKRKILWNDLSRSVPFGDEPWMAIEDFNAILSPNDKKEAISEVTDVSFLELLWTKLICTIWVFKVLLLCGIGVHFRKDLTGQ